MPKSKKTKTPDLPGIAGAGVAQIKLPEVDKAVAKYEREKDRRCAATPGELAAKAALQEILIKHLDQLPVNKEGLRFYRCDDVDYILEEKLKRRKAEAVDYAGEKD